MENSLQTYVNQQFGKIRALMIDDIVWFIGKDVAEALGYKLARKALKDHVDVEDKRTFQIGTPSGKQAMTLINESGLYTLALKSKLDSAKPFRRWVTSEVLPSIRKTGMYVNDKAYEKWLETRGHGTISRKEETSVIKVFVSYARSQGCEWDDKYFYSTITIWCNVGAGLPKKNGRDKASIQELNTLDLLEGTIVKNELISGMANGLHYTQIWAKAQQKIRLFCELTNRELPKLK